jgi:hypothetical protein
MAAPDVLEVMEADVLEADVIAGMVEADQEVLLQATVQVILEPDLLAESQESKQALVERYKAHREALEQAIELGESLRSESPVETLDAPTSAKGSTEGDMSSKMNRYARASKEQLLAPFAHLTGPLWSTTSANTGTHRRQLRRQPARAQQQLAIAQQKFADAEAIQTRRTIMHAHHIFERPAEEAVEAAKQAALRVTRTKQAKAAAALTATSSTAKVVGVEEAMPNKLRWLCHSFSPSTGRSKAQWLCHRELGWDSTVRRYTPSTLRGLKPTTFEPWADDGLMYESEFDRVGEGSTSDMLADWLLEEALRLKAEVTCKRRMKQVVTERTFMDAFYEC